MAICEIAGSDAAPTTRCRRSLRGSFIERPLRALRTVRKSGGRRRLYAGLFQGSRPPRGIVAAFDLTEFRHLPPAALSLMLRQHHGPQQNAQCRVLACLRPPAMSALAPLLGATRTSASGRPRAGFDPLRTNARGK